MAAEWVPRIKKIGRKHTRRGTPGHRKESQLYTTAVKAREKQSGEMEGHRSRAVCPVGHPLPQKHTNKYLIS